MQRFSIVIILASMVYCGQRHSVTTYHGNEPITLDSFLHLNRTQINPLFLNFKFRELNRIIDSLQPHVVSSTIPVQCGYLLLKAQIQRLKPDLDSARFYINQSLELAIASNAELQISYAKSAHAALFAIEKRWDSALHYAHEAYYLSQKYNKTQPSLLQTLFEICIAQGDLASARKYAFEGFEQAYDPNIKMLFVTDIASYYDIKKETDSAIAYFRALEKDTLFYGKNFEAIKNENLGVLLLRKDNPKEALKYLLKAMPISKEIGIFDDLSMFNLADSYAKNRQTQQSFFYLDSAMTYARAEGDIGMIRKIWRLRSENYATLGKHQKATASLDSAYSMYAVEVDSSVAIAGRELEVQYKLRQKDDKITSLAVINASSRKINTQRMALIVALVVLIVMLIVIGILIWRRRQLKTQQREVELRQHLLRSQIQPHFVFNSLEILQSLIIQEKKEKSINYLQKFSQLLRLTINNVQDRFVAIQDEIAALESYLSLQATNFDNGFKYDIKLYEGWENDAILIPPMLLQPFVENSLIHGISKVDNTGYVTIDIRKEGDLLRCNIDDNGSGISPSTEFRRRPSGTAITRDRLAIISRGTRGEGKLVIIDKQSQNQGPGVKVIMDIPFELE